MPPKPTTATKTIAAVAGTLPKVSGGAKAPTATKGAGVAAPKGIPAKLPTIASPEKNAPLQEDAAVLDQKKEIAAAAAAASEAAAAAALEAAAAAAANNAAAAAAAAAVEAEATEAAESAAAAAEATARGNGTVTLVYEMYKEQFAIQDGSTTAAAIDEEYCLSYVMPGCLIHLSRFDSKAKRTLEDDEANTQDIFIAETPRGVYQGLEKDTWYYVYIEQEAEQVKRDQKMMARKATQMEGYKDPNAVPLLIKNDGRGFESCSCSEGAPCVDEYGCKNWGERFAVATKNGWKGF